MSDEIDLDAVTNCTDFGLALTSVRLRAGLSIRAVAHGVRIPASTAGGYFSGAHLPGLQPADLLSDMLRVCGVSDQAELDSWTATWLRLRRGRRGGADEVEGSGQGLPAEVTDGPRTTGPMLRARPSDRWRGPARRAPAAHLDSTAARRTDPAAPAGPIGGEGNGTGPGELAPTITIAAPVARLDRIGMLHGRADLLAHLSAHLPAPGADGGARQGEMVRQDGAAGQDALHVLHGMGGVGKSSVALALAERALDLGIRTWWISATGIGAVPAAMTALAVELGATRHELRNGSLPDLLWRYLRALDEPWLLVVDNVDNPASQLALPGGELLDGTGWLRRLTGTRGMVVITTRDSSAWAHGRGRPSAWVRLHPLRTLSDDDAAAALLDLTGPGAGSPADARALGRRLGGLPLALAFAGHFLARTARMPASFGGPQVPRTFAAYAQHLRAGGAGPVLPEFGETTSPDPPGSARAPGRERERSLVGPTWELSLQVLADQGRPAARPLLALLACFGGDPVPVELLDPATLASGPLFDGLAPTGLWDAFDALAGQGLVELVPAAADPVPAPVPAAVPAAVPGAQPQQVPGQTDSSPAPLMIWLHPLVRDSFRRVVLRGGQAEDYLETVTALLARATGRADPRDPQNWAAWARLRGHADAALVLLRALSARNAGEVPRALRLPPKVFAPATRAGRFLRATGHLPQAVVAYEAVLAMGRPLLGDDHADVLSAEHDLYRVTAALGRQAEAEPGFRVVLDARIRLLGPDHPDTLTTQHYLARTLRELGHVEEALELLTRTFQRRVATLGPWHRDTLTTRNNIGDVLAELGRLGQAEETLRAVWTARVETLGPTHPATLVTLAHLTRLAHRGAVPDRAAAYATDLVTYCREVLGADHPRALAALGIQGEIELGRGPLAGSARADLVDAHERSVRILGPGHPTSAVLARLTAHSAR
ncbi:tetratricopeptide repeat protein [Frankia sp. AiPa1]|uniref:tetratricopeptide repeat protein n=1 Tax=Frankia sp. AiPa1 TaxID=573492 RepID=UPI00202AE3F0|nr:tetratricopeptide repeat protein [Frankia sp. AiPa1]MCL9760421.1 tetratricopeptide repeat protein [Frankia sp. AiPa1]